MFPPNDGCGFCPGGQKQNYWYLDPCTGCVGSTQPQPMDWDCCKQYFSKCTPHPTTNDKNPNPLAETISGTDGFDARPDTTTSSGNTGTVSSRPRTAPRRVPTPEPMIGIEEEFGIVPFEAP